MTVWGQTLAEHLPRHTLGSVISIICNIDKWFNVNYFNVCCQIMKIDTDISVDFFFTKQLSTLQRCIGIMYSGCIINFCMNLKVFLTEVWWLFLYHYITLGKQNCLCFSHFSGLYFLWKEMQEHFFLSLTFNSYSLKAKLILLNNQ